MCVHILDGTFGFQKVTSYWYRCLHDMASFKLIMLQICVIHSVKLCENICCISPCSVPELSFIELQGLTSDFVKELMEEVEKLAKENVGEVHVHVHVRRKRGERAWQ